MAGKLPLAGHEVLRTRDLDEARDKVGQVFCPHDLEVMGRGATFDARQHLVRLGPLALIYLDYSAEIRITPHHISSFYLVHIPLDGAACAVGGGQQVAAMPSQGAVLVSPDQPVTLHWQAGSPHLLVWFDRKAMETTLGQALGRPPNGPLRFDLGLDLTAPPLRRWLEVIHLVLREIQHGPRVATHPLAARHLQQLVITGLLMAARHSHSKLLNDQDGQTPAPPRIRRAEELIRAHAAEPLTVEDVATAVGAGVRSLQQGFRTHLGTTLTAYLRQVRLEYVHAELLAATPEIEVSVTEVALRWGFVHLSRFTQVYRSAYGESPSATLRRSGP